MSYQLNDVNLTYNMEKGSGTAGCYMRHVIKKIALLLSIILLMVTVSPLTAHGEEQISDDELGLYIENEFKKTHIPAMSVEIVSATDVVFADTYGDCASLDSSFILGSISKSFTAVAIMQLVEQGKIDLSSPKADYLPKVSKDCKTTVKQLLNQTSGIKTYDTLENYTTSDAPDEWQYANVNYNLLGQIVENVSGIDYATYIETQIFAPLNMTHSFVSLEKAKAGGLIDGHRNYFGLMVKEEMKYPENTTSGWMTLPAAYIISTANDMGKYLQFYLNGGEGVLTSESIKSMHTDTVYAEEDYQYGFGWGVDNRGDVSILTHGGNVENYTTYMFILPERGLAAIVMFNACDYFVANGMAVQLPYNIAYKLMSTETKDIQATAYMQSHILINVVLLIILLTSILPLIRIKRWWAKSKEKVRVSSIIFAILIHAVLPTLILNLFTIQGIPMFVVYGFAPDVFIVQIISSVILYLVGVFKLIYCVYLQRKSVE